MKVSGFSFIRNGIIYDYPFKEAIKSILPLCDEVILAVGKSDDKTLELAQNIDPKVKILETEWDPELRKSGLVLSDETNKAFRAIGSDSDWAVYIQGDEVMHEDGHQEVMQAMRKWKDTREVDGLLFNYLHFYGSYDYVGASTRWYRHEIRVIKNNPDIYSYLDAQGFRKHPKKKLRVKPLKAVVHHYGWVRKPEAMQRKMRRFGEYWKGEEWEGEKLFPADTFDYSEVDALKKFGGNHPAVMKERIESKNWTFDHDLSKNKYPTKDKIKLAFEKITGHRIGEYRNYKII
jgi:glycosyltransferase involved in cell wall biosynthesis